MCLTLTFHHAKGIDLKISDSMCFGQFSEISTGPLLPPTQPNRVKDLCVEVHCLYRWNRISSSYKLRWTLKFLLLLSMNMNNTKCTSQFIIKLVYTGGNILFAFCFNLMSIRCGIRYQYSGKLKLRNGKKLHCVSSWRIFLYRLYLL